MSLFAISDLHLSLGTNKPMDVFGGEWSNYTEKLKENWTAKITNHDQVIIPGDISWATYIEDAYNDFLFIDSLPGKKYIVKGNHDYWWTTMNKLTKFIEENNFSTISFIQNNHFRYENYIVCGSRGWKCPTDSNFSLDDKKIYERELIRLNLSLKSIKATTDDKIIMAIHYPPFGNKKIASGFVDIMQQNNVNTCIYGHLHGKGFQNAVEGEIDGISYKLISADYIKFSPIQL